MSFHIMQALRDVVDHPAIPENYGGVLLVLGGTFGLNMYLAMEVGKARKKFDVKYPDMYSDDNDEFNCIQRSHQNYLEFLPFFVPSVMVVGLQFPRVATASGLMFLIGRFLYAKGYVSENVKKRGPGFLMSMLGGIFPLVILETFMGARLLLKNGI